MGGIMYAEPYRGREVYFHFPSYHIVWNRAIATTSLVDFRFSWVSRKVDSSVLPVYDARMQRRATYDRRYDGCAFLLVRGEIPEKHSRDLASFALVRRAEALEENVPPWSLYRNAMLTESPGGGSGGAAP